MGLIAKLDQKTNPKAFVQNATKDLGRVGKLFGFDSQAIADAGNRQAQATMEASTKQANALKEQASQAQRQMETLQAQRQASDKAAELLATPVQQADVNVAPASDNIDPVSGKRIKPRDAYSSSSINI